MKDPAEFSPRLHVKFWVLTEWLRGWWLVVQPSPLEQLSLICNSHRKIVVAVHGPREITQMQVGQCGSHDAHAEIFAAGAGRSKQSLRGLTSRNSG
jgi:hypothetical protein